MYNVYGVICGTYTEACEVAGIETPTQIAAEIAWKDAEAAIECQDAMEARGGPLFDAMGILNTSLDIPF